MKQPLRNTPEHRPTIKMWLAMGLNVTASRYNPPDPGFRLNRIDDLNDFRVDIFVRLTDSLPQREKKTSTP